MQGLGRLFDISCGIAPVDFAGGAATGLRMKVLNASAITVVIFKEAGADAEPVTFTLNEHNAAAAGVTQTLPVITEFWKKEATTLAGTEAWVRTAQAAAATVVQASGNSDMQAILAFEVEANSLSAGFQWISVSSADVTTAAQWGGVLYVSHDLFRMRAPELLAATL